MVRKRDAKINFVVLMRELQRELAGEVLAGQELFEVGAAVHASHSLAYFVKTYAEERSARISPWMPSRNPSRRKYILKNNQGGRRRTSRSRKRFPALKDSSPAKDVYRLNFRT